MAHTPGPWISFGEGNEWLGIEAGVDTSEPFSIVVFGTPDDDNGVQGRTVEEARENARLIAAAPELLKACKLVELHFKRNQVSGNFQGDDEHEAWSVIAKAIAKAEGREP